MFCSKCGKKLEEGSNFCEFCGAPVQGPPREKEQLSQAEKTRKSKKGRGLWVVGGVGAAVLAAIGITLALGGKSTAVKQEESAGIMAQLEKSAADVASENHKEASDKTSEKEDPGPALVTEVILHDLPSNWKLSGENWSLGQSAIFPVQDLDTEKYGFIDATGNAVIPLEYDKLADKRAFIDSKTLAGKGNVYTVINSDGTLEASVTLPEDTAYVVGLSEDRIKYATIRRADPYGDQPFYGYTDLDGNVVINPQFVGEYELFKNGYVFDRDNYSETCKVMDKDGNVLPGSFCYYPLDFLNSSDYSYLPNDVLRAGVFNSGLGCVSLNDNEIIVPCIYERVEFLASKRLSSALIRAEDDNDKVGCYNTDGQLIIPVEYDQITVIGEDLIKVKKNDKFGCFDISGNNVIPVNYDSLSELTCNLVLAEKDGVFGYLDKDGNEGIPFIYEDAGTFAEKFGLAYVCQNGKYGYINASGNVVIPMEYEDAGAFEPETGLAFVCKNDMYGYIDNENNTVIPFEYDNAKAMNGGYAFVNKGGFWGLIDAKNHRATSFKYNEITYYSGYEYAGLAADDGRSLFIMKTGRVINDDHQYDYVTPYHDVIITKKDDRQGLLNIEGDVLLPAEYDEINYDWSSALMAKKGEQVSLIECITAPVTEMTKAVGAQVADEERAEKSAYKPEASVDNTQIFQELGILYFEAEEKTSTVRLTTDGEPPDVSLEYTTDGLQWNDYTVGETVRLVNCGEKVGFRNKSEETTPFSKALLRNYRFELSGKVAAYGDITSLINKNAGVDVLPYDCCFIYLFGDAKGLVKAPELPSTTLSNSCYLSMFWGCSGLTEAPELPAVNLANYCYYMMFSGCGNLTEAPELPAMEMKDSCYCSMFQFCRKLQKTPELPSVSLADSCYYYMFKSCRSLTELPELPATELPDACYMYMFEDCDGIMLSETQSDEYSVPFRIPCEGTGKVTVHAYNNVSLSLDGMFNGTGGTFTGEPQVNKTYWQKAGGH